MTAGKGLDRRIALRSKRFIARPYLMACHYGCCNYYKKYEGFQEDGCEG